MTGRELIVYILENGLEDEPIIKDGTVIGFMSLDDFAVKMNVGLSTVGVWIIQKRIEYVKIGGKLYIPGNSILREVEY